MTDITEFAKKHGAIHKISGCTGNPLHLLTVTPQELRAIIKAASAPLVNGLAFYANGAHERTPRGADYKSFKDTHTDWNEIELYQSSVFVEQGGRATQALAEFNKEFGDVG